MIPLIKVKLGEEEKNAVMDVLNSGNLAQGPKVKQLEEEFAQLCGVKYAVAVNSGTAALHTALYTIGIKPGDEVITVPFTFVATANAIMMQGAKPIFVDIKEDTFNIDSEKIRNLITEKTKAILAVDLFGHPCEYDKLWNIANEFGLNIIEDSCQAVCAENNKGEKAGSLGDIAAFSFYATKNLITGEGGIITTNNKKYAELAKRFRHHGQSEQTNYEYRNLGYNYRMTDIMAAIGLCQIKKIKEMTKKRQKNAELFTAGLQNIKGIIPPIIKNDVIHVFHQYTIKITKDFSLTRDELIQRLNKTGIGTGIFYPKPLHLHPHFSKLGYKEGDFPVSEKISKEVLSLPINPHITEENIEKIIKVIKEVGER